MSTFRRPFNIMYVVVHTKNVGTAAFPGDKSILENPREFSPACATYISATAVLSTSVNTLTAICFPFVFNPRRG